MKKEMSVLITADELAEMMRVEKQVVFRLIKKGKLEPIRFGHRVLFDMDQIRNQFLKRKNLPGRGTQREIFK
jgi:excisionase family DNA binding protein